MALHTSIYPTHWFGRRRDKATKEYYTLPEEECFIILKNIILKGFKFSNCREMSKIHPQMAKKLQVEVGQLSFESPMISFTDIPFHTSEYHREKYGNWGLAMKREWLICNRGQPVIYRSFDKEDSFLHRMLLLWTLLNPVPDKLVTRHEK
ncbi:MAG: hypothetical protein A2X86_11930 [Bdellovibrionales bacterium GWA2_49_15]|nr:MAG: hypothetical protein A2X86_11930 [Bdellovibrionales bacterium GWA2_49_15]